MPYRSLRNGWYVILLALTTGCATVSIEPPPTTRVGVPVYISTKHPDSTLKSAAHSIPNSYFGISSHKSGSLALGLLLGPLGTLANVAYLESEASEAAKSTQSIFSENLASLVVRVRPQYSLANLNTQAVQHFEVVPAASLYFTSEDSFMINCYLRVALKSDGNELWNSRYVINSAREYSKTSASINNEVRDHLNQCFGKVMDLLALHIEKGATAFREAEVDFGGRTAVFLVVSSLLPERLVYFDTLGLFDLDKKYWRSAMIK